MSDIKLQSSLLDDLIIKLEQDNLEIVDLIKNSNDAIRTLDDKKWKSKEKIEMDEKLIPYMNNNQILIEWNNSLKSRFTVCRSSPSGKGFQFLQASFRWECTRNCDKFPSATRQSSINAPKALAAISFRDDQ